MELDEVACSVGLKNVHTIDEMRAWPATYEYSNVVYNAFGVSHPIPRGVLAW